MGEAWGPLAAGGQERVEVVEGGREGLGRGAQRYAHGTCEEALPTPRKAATQPCPARACTAAPGKQHMVSICMQAHGCGHGQESCAPCPRDRRAACTGPSGTPCVHGKHALSPASRHVPMLLHDESLHCCLANTMAAGAPQARRHATRPPHHATCAASAAGACAPASSHGWAGSQLPALGCSALAALQGALHTGPPPTLPPLPAASTLRTRTALARRTMCSKQT